jgi:hypothetical protein
MAGVALSLRRMGGWDRSPTHPLPLPAWMRRRRDGWVSVPKIEPKSVDQFFVRDMRAFLRLDDATEQRVNGRTS